MAEEQTEERKSRHKVVPIDPEESRLGLRTGVPAVKKGTRDAFELDPLPPGAAPFQVPEGRTRRDVLWFGAGWGLFAAACATGGAMLLRFLMPAVSFDPKQIFFVGYPEEFPPDTVSAAFKTKNQVWIVNTEYKGKRILQALIAVCTHLGCTPNWLEGDRKFKCPCHGSGFYITGVNFEGPAPRPLERAKIFVGEDGRVVVDKTKKFQQE
ncbi:MAG: ubiquinol-cytochrome c reductase iron-sulfur subunit, partial [Planctomycetota bacterium]